MLDIHNEYADFFWDFEKSFWHCWNVPDVITVCKEDWFE